MRVSKLINPLPGLFLVDSMVARLAKEQGQDSTYEAIILAKARKAINDWELRVCDPETGDLLGKNEERTPLTTIEYFNDWRMSCGGCLLKNPPLDESVADSLPRKALNLLNDSWKADAREQAKSIIARQGKKDLHPNLDAIADEIAKNWRSHGKFGPKGTPLSGAYIKRHALQAHGIAINRKTIISTAKGRGK